MKLIIIIGPPAVGKMTVGQELEKITKLKLFHNHMSLELVRHFFEYGTASLKRVDKSIRFSIFQEVAKSDLEGIIFTYTWNFNIPEDADYLKEVIQIFKNAQAEIYFIELKADLKVRLLRNKSENRLKIKPSKRDILSSEESLLNYEKKYRMNSNEEEMRKYQIIKIENNNMEPSSVASFIKSKIYNKL